MHDPDQPSNKTEDRSKDQPNDADQAVADISAAKRWLYLSLGVLMVLLGIIGAILPVMPTTIFIILAAWFFARSSPKFEARLLASPRFGPMIVKWRERGAIPPRAKLYASLGMIVGYGLFWWGARPGPLLACAVTIFMLGSAYYVLSRPGE